MEVGAAIASGTHKVGNTEGTITDSNTLDLLSRVDFDAQSAAFAVGDAVTGVGSGATGTVRRVDQKGGAVGSLWLSGITGTFADGDDLQVSAASRATANGAQVDPSAWTGTLGTQATITTLQKDTGSGGAQPYDAVIDLNTGYGGLAAATVAQMYERCKWLTRGDQLSATAAYNATVDGTAGDLYITANTAYAVKKPSPLGTFAGGKFFGAQGIFVQNTAAADIQAFELIDSNGTTQNPPNLQTLEVTAVVVGDSVSVYRRTGSAVNKTEFTITTPAGAYNGTGDTIIRVDEAITADHPTAGTVVVGDTRYTYTSFAAGAPGEFTISSALPADLSVSDNCYVPLIEETATATTSSVNLEFVSARDILIRVRKKGILPFEVQSSFGSTGASVAAIRTTDTIVE
jgi:hypothetical protein